MGEMLVARGLPWSRDGAYGHLRCVNQAQRALKRSQFTHNPLAVTIGAVLLCARRP